MNRVTNFIRMTLCWLLVPSLGTMAAPDVDFSPEENALVSVLNNIHSTNIDGAIDSARAD